MQPHISLSAEKIFSIAGLPVTNSLLMTWVVMGVLTFLALLVSSHIRMVPGKLQSAMEMILGGIYDLFSSVVGKDKIDLFFPLLATIFLFVVVANWSGLFPGVGAIGLVSDKEPFIPLFRGPTADLNTTLALAIISVVALQYYGFKSLGLGYITKFINFY